MDKKVKQIEAWAEDALLEAKKKIEEIEKLPDHDYPVDYPAENIVYWRGRKDLAEILLMWIHTGS